MLVHVYVLRVCVCMIMCVNCLCMHFMSVLFICMCVWCVCGMCLFFVCMFVHMCCVCCVYTLHIMVCFCALASLFFFTLSVPLNCPGSSDFGSYFSLCLFLPLTLLLRCDFILYFPLMCFSFLCSVTKREGRRTGKTEAEEGTCSTFPPLIHPLTLLTPSSHARLCPHPLQ